MTTTTKRKVGKKMFSYSTKYIRQLAKAIHKHYFDTDIGHCNVNVEMDGISLTVGSSKHKTFRSPPIVVYKLHGAMKKVDKTIAIFRKKNAKRSEIKGTLYPMWKQQLCRGKTIQH